MNKINNFIVFLASPNDLKEERLLAKKVEEDLNKSISKGLNWQINLLVWEELSPGVGRPQETINKDIKRCDLFVGLLWQRWGTLPGNEYSSGFEEEFALAQECRKNPDFPCKDICLFFKEITAHQSSDPGPQLRKVIDFKKEIETKKELRYKEFKTKKDWEESFRTLLLEKIIEVSKSYNTFEKESKTKSLPSNTILPIDPTNKITTPAMKDIQEIIQQLGKSATLPKKFGTLNSFQRNRLYLFSSALLYNYDIYETMGTHEINSLFKYREKVKPFYFEQKLIFRTIIKDSYDIKPGWFWSHKMTEQGLTKILILFYKSVISDEELKIQCVKILNKMWSKSLEKEMCLSLKDNSANVIKEILNVLQIKGDKESLKYIGTYQVSSDSSVKKEALRAKFSILVRCDHCEAINFLMGMKEDTDIEYSDIQKLTQNSNERELRSLLTNSNDKVQLVAYKELIPRNKLSKKKLQGLLENESLELKYYAYNKLIDQGENFDPKEISNKFAFLSEKLEEEVLLKLFKKYSKSELLKHIDWISLNSPIAYKALGINYFDSFQNILRKDIDNNFERIKLAYIELFAKEITEKTILGLKIKNLPYDAKKIEQHCKLLAEKEMEKKFNKFDNSIKNDFTHAALSVLLIEGHKDDVIYARKYLSSDNSEIKEIAVEILRHFGNDKDIVNLFDIATNSSGSLKEKAAKAALFLDKNMHFKIRHLFLTSNDPKLVKYSLSKDNSYLSLVEKNLLSNNSEIREICISYLIKNLEEEKLLSLLDRHLNEKTYYYNVVCWLDKCLYAPPKLKEVFFKEITGKIDNE